MQADILREKFLNFFETKGHKVIESDSLVPKDDPTVLFTPAGMNQFKKEFMGFDSGFKRAATSQRCLRTDDLDKVGRTSAHHTFFEMLGNFSFGDYFKEEAIAWAWEFLTKELKISADKLWVSVYTEDDVAYGIWLKQIGIPKERIVRLGDKDNFWPAEAKTKGPNGPCGPCSEIFFDFGDMAGCGKPECSPACSCGRFVEIWNLVFTQFNRKEDASLEALPHKNIDTGMGLERLTAVMQGKGNNFETELFEPIIAEIREGLPNHGRGEERNIFYAIADHVRAAVFSIYDGVFPSNEGRGYVVRKIIRKALLHLRSLGIRKPFLNKLVPAVARTMARPYPGIITRQEDIARVILNEEESFIGTLSLSAGLVGSEVEKVRKDLDDAPNEGGYILASTGISGALGIAAFKLYDTNGIPLEVTKDELFKMNIKVSESFEAAFKGELDKQKNLSKNSSKMKGDVFGAEDLGLKVKEQEFLGYSEPSCSSRISALLKDGAQVDEISGEGIFMIALDRTVFYPESGGQVGDTGELFNAQGRFEVLDTCKVNNIILHKGRLLYGVLRKGDLLTAKIDLERRKRISRNHTATHILQAALRKVLGKHVQQQGSMVSDDKLRFDFTHFKGLTKEELKKVEGLANDYIANNLDVRVREMGLSEARKTGALAFFGEKYGQKVRVVSVGDVSAEFCAGAHLKNTGDIGLIKIVQECSVASGIRRIEALTADYATRFQEEELRRELEEREKKERLDRSKSLEKEKKAKMVSMLEDISPEVLKGAREINGVRLVTYLREGLDMDLLRSLMDILKAKAQFSVIALGSFDEAGKKAFLVLGVTPDLFSKGLDALEILKEAAILIKGKGGGRKDFAQAGGSEPGNFNLAFEKIEGIIKRLA